MGGNIIGSSQNNNYITESYRKLGKMDFNGDNKVSGTELKFLEKLGNLGTNPTPDQIKDLFDGMPKEELKTAFGIFLNDRLAKMGNSPTESQLQSFLDSLPDAGFKKITGEILANKIFNDGSVSYDDVSKKITVNAPSLSLDLSAVGKEISEASSLAKDLLDGDDRIAGVEKSVATDFLGGKTYNSTNFKPNEFGFNFVSTEKVQGANGQEATLNIDKRRERMSDQQVEAARSKVDSFSNGKQTFAEFAASKGFSQENFNPEVHLPLVKEFVKTLPKDQQVAFVSKFMSANFEHVGKSIDQTNVGQGNYQEILGKMPKSESGRTYADCTFYAAMSRTLLDSKSTNDQAVRVNFGGVIHDVSVVKSPNGKWQLQSNGEFFNIPPGAIKGNPANMSVDDLKKLMVKTYDSSPEFRKQFPQLSAETISVLGKAKDNDIFNTGVKVEKGAIIGGMIVEKANGNRFESSYTDSSGFKNPIYGVVTDPQSGKYVSYKASNTMNSSEIVIPPGKNALLTGRPTMVSVDPKSINDKGDAKGTAYVEKPDGSFETHKVKMSMDSTGKVTVTLDD